MGVERNVATRALPEVPAGVTRLLDRLADAGHERYLVGGCVRDLLQGRPPGDFDVATAASPAQLLALFPRAVPIGLRHGTVMVPSADGPVDVTCFRAGATTIEADLAHRDFTINAVAYDPRTGRLLDPFEGRSDLDKGRLRAVRNARERLAEDPLRALRAARLAATLDLDVDADLVAAMSACVRALRSVARERVRRELSELLLAERVDVGLALLRRTGLEAALAPGTRPDAAAVVAALPADLELRLAGWLRGARAGPVLRQLRFPRRSVQRVEQLLREHPIEGSVQPAKDVSVRRLLKRVGEAELPALLALRRAELRHAAEPDPQASRALEQLEEALARVRRSGRLALGRHQLALDGVAVMGVLGIGPGPAVGRALRFLTDRVIENPSLNRPEALRSLLEEWGAQQLPAGGSRGPGSGR